MQVPDLRLVSLHVMLKGDKWRTAAMRSYSSDQLLWFTRGQGRLTVAGTTRGFGTHNVVFIPAGTMHAFDITAPVFGTAVILGAGHDLILPDHACHLRIRDAQDQGEMTVILESLQREFDRKQPAFERAMQHYAGLMSVWLERQVNSHEDALAQSSATRRLMRRYSDLVEQGFHSHDSVADYAQRLGVTPTHLTRVCKQSCGRTASSFLTERKLAEARRLLADTRQPVKDIAAGLGFASPAYFTRAFQARVGKPPLAFRKGAA